MLKIEVTKNYTGFNITGDYNDLDLLYDSIYYLIKKEPENIKEYLMQNHIFCFLYDVRHAYQGDREAKLIDNYVQEYKKERLGIKKKDITNNNLYYSFNYLFPDLIQDIILIKCFTAKLPKKERNIYNLHLNMVNFFYSMVLNSLREILTDTKFNKVKKEIESAYILDKIYIPQWFEMVSIDYTNMTKKQREKEIMHILDAICNYGGYEDYFELKKEVEDKCKEKNCNLDRLHYEGYPKEIEW